MAKYDRTCLGKEVSCILLCDRTLCPWILFLQVFTCIKLGDILNDQYAFRHNPPALSARVQNFALQTETFNSVVWNFPDAT